MTIMLWRCGLEKAQSKTQYKQIFGKAWCSWEESRS